MSAPRDAQTVADLFAKVTALADVLPDDVRPVYDLTLALMMTVLHLDRRILVLEPCRSGSGRPHYWIGPDDAMTCGYCRIEKEPA